jgi:hypothetical protein
MVSSEAALSLAGDAVSTDHARGRFWPHASFKPDGWPRTPSVALHETGSDSLSVLPVLMIAPLSACGHMQRKLEWASGPEMRIVGAERAKGGWPAVMGDESRCNWCET